MRVRWTSVRGIGKLGMPVDRVHGHCAGKSMTTAVDTNVLLDAIENNPAIMPLCQSQEWIDIALKQRQDVIICAVVYGELVPSFDSKADMDAMSLRSIGVALSPIDDAIAYEAGLRWQRYRKSGGTRARLLPDFLIGAHALATADSFLTRDEGFYRSYFPELQGL